MKNIPIILSKNDMLLGTIVGRVRHYEALKSGRKDAHGFTAKQDPLQVHIDGAWGEHATTRWMGIPYAPTINAYHTKPDIEPDIEVRTGSLDGHRLIFRPGDNINYRFVFVTGERPPQFIIRGWCWGYEAKDERYKQDYGNRPPAFFVPQSKLREMW